jgi:hypothetical protein
MLPLLFFSSSTLSLFQFSKDPNVSVLIKPIFFCQTGGSCNQHARYFVTSMITSLNQQGVTKDIFLDLHQRNANCEREEMH